MVDTPALAVNKTWVGGSGGNWDTSGNWSPINEPLAGDPVTINDGGAIVNTTGNNTARYIMMGTTAGNSAELLITGNGTLNTALYIYPGVAADASGLIRVTGPNAVLNANAMRVGINGSGTVIVENGGTLNSTASIQIGREYGSDGTFTVRGAGSVVNTAELLSGVSGVGNLNILNGAVFNASGRVIIANNNLELNSVVTVDGAGSQLNSTTAGVVFVVGNNGTGTLRITNGGDVNVAGDAVIGNGFTENSTGTVLVSGTGSRFDVTGDVIVGRNGHGILTVANGGTVTTPTNTIILGAAPTINDPRNLNRGTLNIGTGGTVGSLSTINLIQGNTSGNGTGSVVNFNHNNGAYVFIPVMTGNLGVNQIGSGRTILTSANDYSGLTTITEGTLQLGNGGTTGSIVSDVVNDAHLAFNRSNTYLYAGQISGSGDVTKNGAGTTIFTGDHSYTGLTRINTGTLQIGNGGTTGSLVSDIDNDASLVFNRANTYLYAGQISGSGDVTKNGAGTTIFTGDHSYTGLTRINTGTLQIGNGGESGSIRGNILNNADLVIKRSNTYEYGARISGTGDVTLTGGGSLVLTRQQSFTGETLVENGTLRAGTTDVINASSGLTVRPGSIFHQGGFNQTLANLHNAGLVNMQATAAGTRLTVLGNYVGREGVVDMNTALSPRAAATDRIIIDGGSATGTTALRIHNVSDGGARTTGNGIMVVDAANGGTTGTDTFKLGQRVVGGPYEYGLFRGGSSGGASDSWFLRTTGIRGETSLYPVLPAMGILYGGKLLDTLDQRWGAWLPEDEDLAPIRVASNSMTGLISNYKADEVRRLPEGTWGRIIYQHGKREGMAHGVNGVGASFEHDFYAMQGGIDLYRDTILDGHRVYGGVYGAIGRGEGDVKHFDGAHAGDNSFNAYTLGGYWTHFGPQNWYVDTILQATRYDAKGKGANSTQTLSTDGLGLSASVEGGYPFKLGRGWLLEPQAQLVWSRLDMDDTDDAGGSVNFDAAKSLMGRLGARVARSWNVGRNDKPLMRSVWGRLSSWRELHGEMRVDFQTPTGPATYKSDISGDWWELNGGFTAQINPSSYVTTSLSYYRSYDGQRYAGDIRIGLKIEW